MATYASPIALATPIMMMNATRTQVTLGVTARIFVFIGFGFVSSLLLIANFTTFSGTIFMLGLFLWIPIVIAVAAGNFLEVIIFKDRDLSLSGWN